VNAPVLLIENREAITTVTLNRPESLNALSQELRAALVQAFRRLQNDPDTAVVILTGAGRAFCAGLDFKELGSAALSDHLAAIVDGPENVVQAMRAVDRPIIGAINGFAITGGLELALACDLIIASTAARFADTHARLGIMPGWGLSQNLSRLIGVVRAKELSLTGSYLSAEQAAAWGLVNRVVAPDELLPTCRALAKDMLACVPETIRAIKRVIEAGHRVSLADGLRIEHDAFEAHVKQVTPEVLAARRASIRQQGRSQASQYPPDSSLSAE
jgi:enoyl-CoA hydratase